MGELINTPTCKIYIPDCFCCFDAGVVMYKRKLNERQYEYISRCFCRWGKAYSEEIPLVTDIYNKYEYTKRNFENWYERHKDKPEVINKLKAKGAIE